MNSGRDDPPDRPYRRNPLAGIEVLWMNSGRDDPPDRPYRRNPLAGIEVLWISGGRCRPDRIRAVVIPSRGLRCFGSGLR
jgi:hypothetical protein